MIKLEIVKGLRGHGPTMIRDAETREYVAYANRQDLAPLLAAAPEMLMLLEMAERVAVEMDWLVDYERVDAAAAQTALTNKANLHYAINKLKAQIKEGVK